MEYDEIKLMLELPAARVLRGQNAAMVLGFLHRAFKRQLKTAIAEGELRASLDFYLEELRQTDPAAYPDSAGDYLNRWCEDALGFLRKYYGTSQEEPLYELTSGSEKALAWLESLRQTGFVGTESRLQSIFNGLDEILKFTNADPEERIASLTEEAARIQSEIERIRATGEVETFTPVELNERFALVLAAARELMSDFRLVEENFKRIARDIAERHATPGVTKGAIVGHMLDAHDALRQSDQGQSFFAFWELLIADERRRRFEETLEKVRNLDALAEELRASRLLPQLVSHLLVEGEKVIDSHQRMSVNLRRVLDTANLQERRRVLDLIREVQSAALSVKDRPPAEDGFFELMDLPDVFGSLSRQLWQAPESALLSGPIEEAGGARDFEDLRRFGCLPQIRLAELRKNIEACLSGDYTVTLQQVLDRFPPGNGVLEVLGYLVIASSETRHFVADDTHIIDMPAPSPQRWRVPRVLFCKG